MPLNGPGRDPHCFSNVRHCQVVTIVHKKGGPGAVGKIVNLVYQPFFQCEFYSAISAFRLIFDPFLLQSFPQCRTALASQKGSPSPDTRRPDEDTNVVSNPVVI